MDLHIAVKWVEALRSGRYRQTEGKLHGTANGDIQEVGFCCLGVLCDLHRDFVNDQLGEEVASWSLEGYHCGVYSANSVLPENVRRWAGLKSQNPSTPATAWRTTYLSDLNDTGRPFSEIAGVIEENAATL